MIGKRKFVKYRNRKIHELGSDQSYVSMEEIAVVVEKGEDVEVVEDATGKDLTLVTLARILYDRCREPGSKIPVNDIRTILAGKKAA